MKTFNKKEYYSFIEVSEILGERDKPLHLVSCRNIVRREKFEKIKLGRVKYILKSDIDNYTLRHTFVTMLLHNGVNIKDIQTLVGHSDIKTTMNIYCKSTTESLSKAVNGLNY